MNRVENPRWRSSNYDKRLGFDEAGCKFYKHNSKRVQVIVALSTTLWVTIQHFTTSHISNKINRFSNLMCFWHLAACQISWIFCLVVQKISLWNTDPLPLLPSPIIFPTYTHMSYQLTGLNATVVNLARKLLELSWERTLTINTGSGSKTLLQTSGPFLVNSIWW